MEWIVNDSHPSFKIVENEELSELKQWMMENNCACKVYLGFCDHYFWLTPAERSSLQGSYGAQGPVGPRGCIDSSCICEDTRLVQTDKKVTVTFSIIVPTKLVDLIKSPTVTLTSNYNGDTLPTWTFTPGGEYIPLTFGAYKRDGFDAAFNAMKVLKKDLDEEDFATIHSEDYGSSWDTDLVDVRPFNGIDGCIKTFVRSESIETGKSRACMSFLACDIGSNIDYIKEILSAYCHKST